MLEFYVVSALIIVIGVPFVLYWWKFADRWAAEEHKRFGRKPGPSVSEDVVVKSPGTGQGTEESR